jgi:hypothetical protein
VNDLPPVFKNNTYTANIFEETVHKETPILQVGCSLHSAVQCITVRYSTVQYSTVQYNTVQYSTVQYSTVQCSTVQYRTVQYSIEKYSTVQSNKV